MRALTIVGKQDASVADVDIPEPGVGQVRIRMAYAGICGSDLHYYYDGANGTNVIRGRLVPGHEMSGRVDLDPSGELAPDTPVTVHPATFGSPEPGIEGYPHLWPGGSYMGSAATVPHVQGGMAEYVVVGREMVRVLPGGLPLRRAALAEPLAVALHAVRQAGGTDGARVLVTGSGPIGLLCAAAAKVHGAREVTTTDLLGGPLARARRIGADVAVRTGVDDLPTDAFDVVFECTGVPAAINAAIGAVRRAGTVAQVGMVPVGTQPLDLATLIVKEARYVTSFRFLDEIDEAVAVLATHPELDAVITHTIPVDDFAHAFATAKDSEASGKVLISLID